MSHWELWYPLVAPSPFFEQTRLNVTAAVDEVDERFEDATSEFGGIITSAIKIGNLSSLYVRI